uniref:glucan 1,3-beta-glucosidase n=1 Tax=Ganoderma boninense TaxID=34458 RepID=A0A5K1K6H4_9APHY|nr:Protein kinase domain-containing protein [Ganoderma boninense]
MPSGPHETDISSPATTAHGHFETPPTSPRLGPQSDHPGSPNPRDGPRNSGPSASPASSGHILSEKPLENDPHHGEGSSLVTHLDREANPKSKRRRRYICLAVALLILIIVVLVIVLPIVLTSNAHSGSASSSGDSSGNGNGNSHGHGGSPGSPNNPESPTGAVTGGDGSVVVMADGSSFKYTNRFGGFWVDDPRNPFNNSARAQSFTKSLDEAWDYSTDQIRGVNLGGWLVLEPFIAPAMFEKYQNVPPSDALPGGDVHDEWTLSVAMLNDTTAGGGIGQIEEHYKTFITEEDFAQIAGAGLNWIRLPVPYWAIETWPGEPFLARKAWDYVLLALQWARKYGLRVYLELHTVPGSQNGYNHSGHMGTINFLNGYMGVANAQRTMDYIRFIAEFISQEGYTDVVQMFGPINEPLLGIIGRDQLTRFYLQTHDLIRSITGIGKGAYIVIHDGFQADITWKDFLPGSDRIVLDTHPYVAFGGDFDHPLSYWPQAGCIAYGNNQSQMDFGVTISGEWSGAINNCGKWVLDVGQNSTYAQCPTWDDWPNWTADMKTGIKNFVMSQMDSMALPGYFFWTWKIGNSSITGKVEAPFWSYKLGLDNGWIPDDPRSALGICQSLGFLRNLPWNGDYQSWQTGGAGAGTIAPAVVAEYSQYPPPALSNVAGANPAQLPMYTATAAPVTLPPPQLTGATVSAGDGWADARDTMSKVTEIAGCSYPNAWGPEGAATAMVCNGATVPIGGAAPPAAVAIAPTPAPAV